MGNTPSTGQALTSILTFPLKGEGIRPLPQILRGACPEPKPKGSG